MSLEKSISGDTAVEIAPVPDAGTTDSPVGLPPTARSKQRQALVGGSFGWQKGLAVGEGLGASGVPSVRNSVRRRGVRRMGQSVLRRRRNIRGPDAEPSGPVTKSGLRTCSRNISFSTP